MKVGAGRALDYIPRFGFETKNFPRNTQLAIGGGTMGVTPLEMVRAYAVIANGGFLVEPHVIDKILDPKQYRLSNQPSQSVSQLQRQEREQQLAYSYES